jgi:hypothetical protein
MEPRKAAFEAKLKKIAKAKPTQKMMTPSQAIAFVRKHGVVLESGRGPVPSLAEEVAQGPIKGSWWSHPQSREIYARTRAIRDDDNILVCRAVGGKITFVHRRLWPALVRLAGRIPHAHLAKLKEEHTPTGRHVVRTISYPDWASAEVSRLALKLSESDAIAQLGSWVK